MIATATEDKPETGRPGRHSLRLVAAPWARPVIIEDKEYETVYRDGVGGSGSVGGGGDGGERGDDRDRVCRCRWWRLMDRLERDLRATC